MNKAEVEARFREIVKKDTKLDEREQLVLLNMYIEMMDMAELGLVERMSNTSLKITGAIELLMDLEKIQDDEDLYMLMNEIEAELYKRAEEET